MKRIVWSLLLLVVFSSCRIQPKRILDKIDIVSVGACSLTANQDAFRLDVLLDVENNATRIKVKSGVCSLYYGERSTKPFAIITVSEPLVLVKGHNPNVAVGLDIRLTGGIMGALSIRNLLSDQRREKVKASGSVVVAKGILSDRLHFDKMPLSVLLTVLKQ